MNDRDFLRKKILECFDVSEEECDAYLNIDEEVIRLLEYMVKSYQKAFTQLEKFLLEAIKHNKELEGGIKNEKKF